MALAATWEARLTFIDMANGIAVDLADERAPPANLTTAALELAAAIT